MLDADLRSMLLIRGFEQRLLALFAANKVAGTTHTCLGQEYVPVALAPLLLESDFVFSHHRGHGHYLARFHDPKSLLAEILGREGAVCRGVGGSQHIRRGRYLSTGVQGESVAAAAGAALHVHRLGEPSLAVAYIGDGTWGEGTVYEALNIASLWRLPLLIVVEHNGIAQTTPTKLAMAGTIEKRARAFDVDHIAIETNQVDAIRSELAQPIAAVRAGRGPLVVEFATVRLGPHSKGDDTRPPEELARIAAADWLRRCSEESPESVARLEADVSAELARVFEEVDQAPPSQWSPT